MGKKEYNKFSIEAEWLGVKKEKETEVGGINSSKLSMGLRDHFLVKRKGKRKRIPIAYALHTKLLFDSNSSML